MTPLIRLEDVEFAYGGTDGFRISVPALTFSVGEHAAIVGPSGCGKTTLLSLIAGILRPSAGTVVNQNETVSELTDQARRAFRICNVGLVFQAFELLDYLNVLDNVLLPYRVHPNLTLNDDVCERASALIDSVGLEGKAERNIDALSQGEQQRVAVARALVTRPPLVLADEPTGNLDPVTTERIIDLLRAQAEHSNTTIITVTHDHSLLDRFDRVVEFGSILA